jgi:alpha-tubulin suppressor-like RCC1 family protein
MSCAVTDAGALYTWGRNQYGNLGHGDVHYERKWPERVQGLQGIRVVGVSICATHTLALAANGSVYAFGKSPGLGISREDQGGQVDDATPSPRPRRIPELVCMVPRQ